MTDWDSELKKIDKQLESMSDSALIPAPAKGAAPAAKAQVAAERAYLVAKLRAYDWNVSETARALDMPRSNLYKKIERYGLSREGGGIPAPVSGPDEDDDA
jgi:transcriptional regulator of acetoin/glycerol metabolism